MAQVQGTARRAATLKRTDARQPSIVKFSGSRPRRSVHTVTRGDDHSASTKYSLASQINRLLDDDKLSQLAAAERLGISQSKVSAIRNYKLHGISLERLMQALVALDQQVAIVVGPSTTPSRESVSVVL
jgi:predicted XRE-type DNA-binding protein